jgi:GR25 family glycosyltransferase involved in LPS biosynthesis
MKVLTERQVFYGTIFVTFFLISFCYAAKKNIYRETMENNEKDEYIDIQEDMKIFVINLDDKKYKLDRFINQYENYDISNKILLNRYPAIDGNTIEPEDWLTKKALDKLNESKRNGYRKYHHELTNGGIGCFLSHLSLYKNLLIDENSQMYFIFEDDAYTKNNIYTTLENTILPHIPNDWDVIILGYSRISGEIITNDIDNHFLKPSGFWGLYGYIIRKSGAEKIIKEVEVNKIDGQIDAYLSRMQQQDKINIYMVRNPCVFHTHYENNKPVTSSIQTNVRKIKNINPNDFDGYIV